MRERTECRKVPAVQVLKTAGCTESGRYGAGRVNSGVGTGKGEQWGRGAVNTLLPRGPKAKSSPYSAEACGMKDLTTSDQGKQRITSIQIAEKPRS